MKKFFKSIWEFIVGVEAPIAATDNTYEAPKVEEDIKIINIAKPQHLIVGPKDKIEELQRITQATLKDNIKIITPEEAVKPKKKPNQRKPRNKAEKK